MARTQRHATSARPTTFLTNRTTTTSTFSVTNTHLTRQFPHHHFHNRISPLLLRQHHRLHHIDHLQLLCCCRRLLSERLVRTVIRRNLHLRLLAVISYDPFHPTFSTACCRTNPLTCSDNLFSRPFYFCQPFFDHFGFTCSQVHSSSAAFCVPLCPTFLYPPLWPILALAPMATPPTQNTTCHSALRAGSNLRFALNLTFTLSTAPLTFFLWSTNTFATTHSTRNPCQTRRIFRTREHTTSSTECAAT